MPELPEVETIRRGLEPPLQGRRLKRVTVRRTDLRRPLPADFAKRLTGRRVERLGRRAKYLLLYLDNGVVVIGHLGMSGSLTLATPATAPGTHDHLLFDTDDGGRLLFNDPRRFGLFALATTNSLDDHPLLSHLGPDPLEPAFDTAYLARALAGRKAPIKALLLDQRLVSGIGNIYASEALFRAGIAPHRAGGAIGRARLAGLVEAIRAVLTDAIAAGGSSLRDYVQASGELGYFQHTFAVYDREGEPCPSGKAGHRVRRMVQSNRSTFYCPRCQR